MKVLNIIQRYSPAKGGAELFMQILSEYLANKFKYKVDVWTTNANNPETLWELGPSIIEKEEETINNVNVRRFKIGSGLLRYKYINKIFRTIFENSKNFKLANLASCPTVMDMLEEINSLKKGDYDIVTVSSTPYYFLFYVGYLISKKLDIPYVVIPALHIGIKQNDQLKRKYLKETIVEFFNHANKIILNTEAEGNEIIKYCEEKDCRLLKDKFVVVGQGIFLDKCKTGIKERFIKKYNLKYPIVFQIGTKNKDKGSYNLIESMIKLWDKGIKCHLVFAGVENGEFSKYIDKLDEKYKNFILNINNISEEEKNDLYEAGDIYSMVSKTDSFGIVYLEAWSHKKPVLACDNLAIKEIINDGINGYLIEFSNIDAIAFRIEKLLNTPKTRQVIGLNGYKKLVQKYDWNKNIQKLNGVYENITG